MENRDNLYLVVTAVGSDQALSDLTRALHGREVAKALAMITSEGSLLQQTMANFQSVLPFRNMYVLVAGRDEAQARSQLGSWPDVKVVAVPEGHGAACALLLVLAEILTESPQAEIVVSSAECYVANPRPFIEALVRTRVQLGLVSAVLFGAAPANLEPGHWWMEPGTCLAEDVFALVDAKLPSSDAECAALLEEGALWSTSTFLARGPFLLRVLARAMPVQADAIAKMWRTGRPSPREVAYALSKIASHPSETDLDRLLMREVGTLAIARVEGTGWNDWSTPEQVFHSLRSPFELAWLLTRLTPDGPAPRGPQAGSDRPAMALDSAPNRSRGEQAPGVLPIPAGAQR